MKPYALLFGLLLVACATVSNTPAQDLAWQRWKKCEGRFPTATLGQITGDGRISFSYKHPSDLSGMNECLRNTAEEQNRIAATAAPARPGLPDPPVSPAAPPAQGPPPLVSGPPVAYTFRVVDDGRGGSVGNGDGRIQKGETVTVRLSVKNVSASPLAGVAVLLASPGTAGLRIETGRADLGGLGPGEIKTTMVGVGVQPTFVGTQVTMRLRLQDGQGGMLLEDDLRLPVDSAPPRPITAVDKTVRVSGASADIHGGIGAETPVIAVANAVEPLTVTGELDDWYRVRLGESDIGWVSKRSVADYQPVAPSAPTVRAPAVVGVFQNAAPVIALASPSDGHQVTADRVQIIGAAASTHGVTRVEIRVNGQLAIGREPRGVAVKPTGTAGAAEWPTNLDFSERIVLAEGRNEIVVTATDAQNLSASRTLTVTRVTDRGQIFAVVIGISRYKSIRSLRFADRDAIAFADYLAKDVGVPASNITLVINEDASLVNLKRALGTELRRRAGEKDTVIIYYAGHGAPESESSSADEDGMEKYLVPHDGDPKDLYTTALPMREVETIFARLSAERVIFITDSCYSGATGGRTFATASRRAIVSDTFLARLSRGKGRVVLTASRASEVSEEREDLGHGIFTYYLLEGLRGPADLDGDGIITVDEAYAYVSRKVPEATGQNQHPLKKGEVEGQLVLGRTR